MYNQISNNENLKKYLIIDSYYFFIIITKTNSFFIKYK